MLSVMTFSKSVSKPLGKSPTRQAEMPMMSTLAELLENSRHLEIVQEAGSCALLLSGFAGGPWVSCLPPRSQKFLPCPLEVSTALAKRSKWQTSKVSALRASLSQKIRLGDVKQPVQGYTASFGPKWHLLPVVATHVCPGVLLTGVCGLLEAPGQEPIAGFVTNRKG